MKKLLCFVLIFNCFFIPSFAQKNFLPSSIITNEGDTLQGLIDYKGWDKNPRKIYFKKDENAALEVFEIWDVREFFVDGRDKYVRAMVTKDMAPVDLNRLQAKEYKNIVKDTVFLRQVVKGKELALYELNDEKLHYYIQKKGESFKELEYRVWQDLKINNRIYIINGFRNQLKQFLVTADERLLNKIDAANYNGIDLRRVVVAIDTSAVSFQQLTISKPEKSKSVEYFVGAALARNKVTFEGQDFRHLTQNTSPTSFGYSFRAGIKRTEQRRLKKLFGIAEIMVANLRYKNEVQEVNWLNENEIKTYEIEFINVTPTISGNYNYINKQNWKSYIGVGLGYNYTFYSKNEYTDENTKTGKKTTYKDDLNFNKSWVELSARIGVNYKSIDMMIYNRIYGSFSNYTYMRSKFNSTSVGFYYHF